VLTQSAGRAPFGGLLAPGRYTRVVTESLDRVCVLSHPGSRQVVVVAVDVGDVLVRGDSA
jgi:hypothetical protein